MIAIDKVCYNSKLRYENPQQKMGYGIATLLVCVGSQSYGVSIGVLLLNTYLIVYKSGVSFRRFWHYMSIPVVFILLSTLSIIVNFSIQPLDAFALSLSPLIGGSELYITCSQESFYFAGRLILTALASVTNLYFISFTTPMPDILMVMQKVKIPSLFIEMMLLIYRYIFILLEMADNIYKAQCVRLGNRNYKTSIKSFVQLISVLFIRSMKKSNMLFDAMESRGYDGRISVLNENHSGKHRITIGIILFELLLIGMFLLEQKGGII